MAVTFLADHGGAFTTCPCELKRELCGIERIHERVGRKGRTVGQKVSVSANFHRLMSANSFPAVFLTDSVALVMMKNVAHLSSEAIDRNQPTHSASQNPTIARATAMTAIER
jgi:hypothetical protein